MIKSECVLTRERALVDFWHCVSLIKDTDIREMVNAALEEAPANFWFSKGSNSGKNHPPENNLEDFGLIVHIIKAVQIAIDSFRFFDISSYEEDMVIAAIILHDIYKYGENWDRFDETHGLVCANKLNKFTEIHPYVLEKIQLFIETHMSRWAHPVESMKKFLFQDRGQLIVALADYYSSRCYISFYPGLSILGGRNEQKES